MKIDFKINMQDVNSDHINKEIEAFGADLPPGVSVIQQVDGWNASLAHNISGASGDIQLIVVSTDDELLAEVHTNDDVIPVRGAVEYVKLYLMFSDFVILDGHQTICFEDGNKEWKQKEIILCGLEDAKSVDGSIYG